MPVFISVKPSANLGCLLAEWLFDGIGDSARWKDQPLLAAEHVRNISNVIKELDVDILGEEGELAHVVNF